MVGVWTDFCDNSDPLIAEARAALLAVKKIKDLGFKYVCFEGDSLVVFQAIQGLSHAQRWTIDCIMDELRSYLPAFSLWIVSHVCRDLNSVAHAIARWLFFCKLLGTIPILGDLGTGRRWWFPCIAFFCLCLLIQFSIIH